MNKPDFQSRQDLVQPDSTFWLMPIRWVHARLEYGKNYFAVSYLRLVCSFRSELLRITIPSPGSHMLDPVKAGVEPGQGTIEPQGPRDQQTGWCTHPCRFQQ